MGSVETSVRGYRRGIQYRKGNISKEQIIKELGFKDVLFNKDTTLNNEEQTFLNYTYDSLRDLSNILNIPLNLISLRNKDNNVPNLAFTNTDKSYVNFVVAKQGKISINWYLLLDKYLGYLQGLDSIAKNLNLGNSNDVVTITKELVQILKLKENREKQGNTLLNKLEEVRFELEELLEKMPIKQNASVDEIMLIEDSRERFIRELSRERLKEMFDTFDEHDVSLGDLKDKFLECFKEAEKLREEQQNEKDFVNTRYFDSFKNSHYSENDTDKLIANAFNWYINEKLKELNQYNNFLVFDLKEEGISIESDEGIVFKEAIEKYLNVIIPYLIENLNSNLEEENKDNLNDNIEEIPVDREQQINSVLNEDMGKFKLTLFKKLAKDAGLNIDTSKIENNCYYIYFKDAYIHHIRASISYNPKEPNHCINVYCENQGDKKLGYWWDNDLDYNNLISFLCNLEKENKRVKFKLTYFKELCEKYNLNPDKGISPEVNQYSQTNSKSKNFNITKYYQVNFKSKDFYIIYVLVPIYINIAKENKIKIKTVREEVYHSWTGELNYIDLVEKLKRIEQMGIKEIEDDFKQLKLQKDKETKETQILKNQTEKEYKQYQKDMKNKVNKLFDEPIKSTKDLRKVLVDYLKINNIKVDYPAAVSVALCVVKENIYKLSNGLDTFNIELTTIPDTKLSGNAKNWSLENHNLLKILRRSENSKSLEGLVEGTITRVFNDKKYSKVQKQMLIETITYMICKLYKLDVRTYCQNKEFEKLVTSDKETLKNYLKLSFKLFNETVLYFK